MIAPIAVKLLVLGLVVGFALSVATAMIMAERASVRRKEPQDSARLAKLDRHFNIVNDMTLVVTYAVMAAFVLVLVTA